MAIWPLAYFNKAIALSYFISIFLFLLIVLIYGIEQVVSGNADKYYYWTIPIFTIGSLVYIIRFSRPLVKLITGGPMIYVEDYNLVVLDKSLRSFEIEHISGIKWNDKDRELLVLLDNDENKTIKTYLSIQRPSEIAINYSKYIDSNK